jgi:hypothetical protein
MDKHNIMSETNYGLALEENLLMRKSKQTSNEVIIIVIVISLTQIEVIIEN